MLIIIIGVVIALSFFFYFNKRRLGRLEDRQQRSRERFEKLLQSLRPAEQDGSGGEQENKSTR